MTEQIKIALEVLGTYDMSEDNDDTEFKDSIALAINSLNAWSEVLNELEEERAFEDSLGNDEATVELDMCIRIINQHLAEIEERN